MSCSIANQIQIVWDPFFCLDFFSWTTLRPIVCCTRMHYFMLKKYSLLRFSLWNRNLFREYHRIPQFLNILNMFNFNSEYLDQDVEVAKVFNRSQINSSTSKQKANRRIVSKKSPEKPRNLSAMNKDLEKQKWLSFVESGLICLVASNFDLNT